MNNWVMKYWLSLDVKTCKDSAFAAILLLIIVFFLTQNQIYIKITAVSSILAMLSPKIFKPFAFIWFGISKVLGLFVPSIVLSIIYFLFVFPVGLLRKVTGKDDMNIRSWKKGSESVFVERNHVYKTEDLHNPF